KRVIAVVGNTGVGKSQLAVEIAASLRGEVINTDALQASADTAALSRVYRGFDVLTNKMPIEERKGVPHHLMEFVDSKDTYGVVDFEQDALRTIEDIHGRARTPVLVGGTHYYLQSMLWKQSLIAGHGNVSSPSDEEGDPHDNSLESGEDTSVLYHRLRSVDPIMAERWHPNDRRKIIRSLQVSLQWPCGCWQVQLIDSKANARDGSRYPVCIIWVHAEAKALNQRLDHRVDVMIKASLNGLLDEIAELRWLAQEKGDPSPDHKRGVAQGIGKRGHSYRLGELSQLMHTCTEQMKAATRRYAKRQTSWISNKLLPVCADSGDENQVRMYVLDATSLDRWDEQVGKPGVEVARAFLEGKTGPLPSELNPQADALLGTMKRYEWRKHVCPTCLNRDGSKVVLNGELEWKDHMRSRRHRRQAANMKRRQQ
ncbi:IPP transferase-domain-containing protein, partial [Thamnocephalis sphaerospora]